MEGRSDCMRLGITILCILFTPIDARFPVQLNSPSEPTDAELYGISSGSSLPPLESLAPIPFPISANGPPFCVNPEPPSTTLPSPTSQKPPPFTLRSPPPSPPVASGFPPLYTPSPNPPQYKPSPPKHAPNPPKSVPNPPVVFPPPLAPPPPHRKPQSGLWCVAKPSVPDSIIQEALDYACGTGADCKSIQPSGPCFQPNTMFSHASYAFNSYWQSKKATGGTCDFGGTAVLVTTDPSYNDCYFNYN